MEESAKNQTMVALRLTGRVLLNEAAGKNAVLSPLSLHMLLSIGSAAMSGSEKERLLSFLNAKSTDDLHKLASDTITTLFVNNPAAGAFAPKVIAANGIWIDRSRIFKPKFKSVVDEAYKAVTEAVDFKTNHEEVVKEVNEWAEKNTNGLIKNAISPGQLNCDTRVILANVIYFKAEWQEKFIRFLTRDEDFHRLDGSSVRVPFMRGSGLKYMSAREGFKILSLGYRSGGRDDGRMFSMYFLLPDARDGLSALVERACSEPGFLDRYKPSSMVHLEELRIPKFKISLGLDALELLGKMGLELGCITEMVEPSPGDDPILVDNMIHKAAIEMDEDGTEAAALTMMRLRGGGCPMVRDEFVADHPFMFLIREEVTGIVLFTGQVVDPSQNE